MMLNDGQFGGRQAVPASVSEELSDGGDVDAFTNGTESKGVMGNGDGPQRQIGEDLRHSRPSGKNALH